MPTKKFSGKYKQIIDLINSGVHTAYPGAVCCIGTSINRTPIIFSTGYKQLVPVPEKMDTATIFDLASLTKPIATATAIMLLRDKHKLDINDKVGKYLSWFHGNEKQGVTLKHLLAHTSGLPATVSYLKNNNFLTRTELIKKIQSTKLCYTPNKKVLYSDLNFILLGWITEKVSGQKLNVFCKTQIFRKLGMRETGYNTSSSNIIIQRYAATEFCRYRAKVVRGSVHDEVSYILGGTAGHAGLFSTAFELSLFCGMMLNGGKYGNTTVLSPESISLMTQNHTPGLNASRGLGWGVIDKNIYGHTGFTGTSIWINNLRKTYMVLLTNRVHPTRDNMAIAGIRKQLLKHFIALRG
ncbi:MAG: serine hydrolase domain-containing protein [Elusimicrobiota bacterium]